jgi:hypothetical protein
VAKLPNLQYKYYLQKSALVNKYKIRIENSTYGFIYQGEVDEKEQRSHMTVMMKNCPYNIVEMFREKGQVFGRLVNEKEIYQISSPMDFSNYLKEIINIVSDCIPTGMVEASDALIVDFKLDTKKTLADKDSTIKNLLSSLGLTTENLDVSIAKLIGETSATASVRFSKHDKTLKRITLKVICRGKMFETNIQLTPADVDIIRIDRTMIKVDPKIKNFHDLLAYTKTLGGWMEKDHQYWTQRSLDLIERIDSLLPLHERKYRELYTSLLVCQKLCQKYRQTGL